ncbi:hypothetical protein PBI_SCTP2_342 [Salicola phage SCTP-2]|nr:hypothetical protein PBI_SCTP2_342 [Salicola phage SCTP-2]
MTNKRRNRLYFENEFNISLYQLYDVVQIDSKKSYKSIKDIRHHNDKILYDVLNDVKKNLYRKMIKRFKESGLKHYWIDITMNASDQGIHEELQTKNKHHQQEMHIVTFDFFYIIHFRISQQDINRLKITDEEFFDMLNDENVDLFEKIFCYTISN